MASGQLYYVPREGLLQRARATRLAAVSSSQYLGNSRRNSLPAPLTMQQLRDALADRYRIERELGAGGMATVYLAEDVRHKRMVALKVLHPELSAVLGPERFLKEIELTASLQHPHILPLFDSGSADAQLFYVMPFVDGETLRARLDREQQLPIADALRIAREVADALQYAHDRGVIHRDIKPENILLQSGHALVADFGIALAVQQAGGTRMTQTGLSLGTPQYMAPEQAMGERAVDVRADIYALGAVLYEMLAGEPPFTGPNAQSIVARVLTTAPAPVSATRATVPPHVDNAVAIALAKLPADRFASARAFSEALGDASPSGARAIEFAHRAPAVHRWKRAIIPALVGIAGVGLGALIASRVVRGSTTPAQVTRVVMETPVGEEFRLNVPGTALTISGDGKRIVYVGPGGGVRGTQLWQRSLDQLSAKPIPDTNSGDQPKLSPEGRFLFFRGVLTSAFATMGRVVSLESGEAIAVPGLLSDAAWGADGRLYIVRIDGAIDRMVVGGSVERVAPADSALGRSGITVLPGERGALLYRGRRIAPDSSLLRTSLELVAVSFTSRKVTPLVAAVYGQVLSAGRLLYVTENGSVVVAPFDLGRLRITGPGVPLFKVDMTTGFLGRGVPRPQLAVSSDGTVLYSPPSVGVDQELVWLDPDGRERPAAPLAGKVDGLALSTDGARVAVTLRREPSSTDTVPPEDVWVMNLKTSATTRLTTAGQNIRPTWSLDGARVLFVARDGLLERPADASAPVRRVVSDSVLSGRRIAEGSWVSGGRLLLRNYPGSTPTRDIMLYDPAARDSPPRVIVGPPGDKTNPRISPDGKWLAYGSNETGRYELYVIPFPGGGARVAVSTEGGNHARWSADGRTLYYFTIDGALMMASVSNSGGFSVGERHEHPSHFRHTSDTDPFYDVSRDGRILVAKALTQTHRMVLVRNWFAELDSAR